MPGAFKNKAIGALAVLVFGYFLITDPVGTGHAVAACAHSLGAFLHALH